MRLVSSAPNTSPASVPGPVVFAYDFPHKKTQDIIVALMAAGIRPLAVLAAPFVKLPIPPSSMRVKPRHVALMDPKELCAAFKIDYYVVDHRSDECLMKLDLLKPQIGMIAGARILSRHVIESFKTGIVNLHPGLLPNTRGLDALQWALFRDQPLGVTAHLINERVDAGHILDQRIIDEYPDDTFVDLSLRLYETQLLMVASAMRKAVSVSRSELPAVGTSLHNAPFPAELVPQLRWRFRERRRRLRHGRPGAMSAIA